MAPSASPLAKSNFEKYLASTIGKKQVMGVAGLGLCGFVLIHMLGNLLILKSPEAFNHYSYNLITNPAIYIAEFGLLAIYLLHIAYAIQLTLRNRAARPVKAYQGTNGNKAVSWASKWMLQHGGLIFVFVALHLATFKWGTYYEVTYDQVVMRDLYKIVVEIFQNPLTVAWYVLCMIFLGFHLSHGFTSSFRTLGLDHPRYLPWVKRAGYAFAIVVAGGFILEPVYAFLCLKP